MQLWAAIDILGGRVVSLVRGNVTRPKRWDVTPVEAAHRWELEGAFGLHVVDLDRAFGMDSNEHAIRDILRATGIPVQVGGGIRSPTEALSILRSGANRLVIGTMAFAAPDDLREIIEATGPDNVALAIDYKGDQVLTHGWTLGGGMHLLEAASFAQRLGIRTLVATATERDGMAEGPDFDTYRKLRGSTGLEILASGGIRSNEDIASLGQLGVNGVILGRGLYEGSVKLPEAGRVDP